MAAHSRKQKIAMSARETDKVSVVVNKGWKTQRRRVYPSTTKIGTLLAKYRTLATADTDYVAQDWETNILPLDSYVGDVPTDADGDVVVRFFDVARAAVEAAIREEKKAKSDEFAVTLLINHGWKTAKRLKAQPDDLVRKFYDYAMKKLEAHNYDTSGYVAQDINYNTLSLDTVIVDVPVDEFGNYCIWFYDCGTEGGYGEEEDS